MELLKSKKINILGTMAVSLVCFFLLHQSGALEGAGMAALFLNWLPLIIGAGTLICYLIWNAIAPKYSWIAALLGNAFNILILIRAMMEV